jgi:hypothetical protein
MGRKKLADIIDDAEAECENAVAYVGAANYAEREREAERMVAKAFDRIRKARRTGVDRG